MTVMIIDYGMGNLRSAANAFEVLGHSVQITDQPSNLRLAKQIVLPGVGSFKEGMHKLQSMGWVDCLEEEVKHKGKPFLGLCLGMQFLGTTGTEHGQSSGLNWMPGIVDRIQTNDPAVRVPHIGWNDVNILKSNGLYAELGESQTFYFVHSYVFRPDDPTIISGMCQHGAEFVASVEKENIFGTQFHPEKSQKAGLTVLKNFMKMGV